LAVSPNSRAEPNKEAIDPGLRKLYVHMTDDQVREAQRNLKRYVAVIVRIYDRLKAEGKSWPPSES
jgi:hypothetical protein